MSFVKFRFANGDFRTFHSENNNRNKTRQNETFWQKNESLALLVFEGQYNSEYWKGFFCRKFKIKLVGSQVEKGRRIKDTMYRSMLGNSDNSSKYQGE